MNYKTKTILAYLLVVIWMIVIFLFSNATGDISGGSSKGILSHIVTFTDNIVVKIGVKDKALTNNEKEKIVESLNIPIRKLAHFSEYLILCILWLRAFNLSNVKHKYIFALILSILYAMSDEYHQTFIAGRSGQAFDVFIDSSGSFMGNLIYYIYNKFKKIKS